MGSSYRHTRQVRLVDVGEAGQARLASAIVDVGSTGFAGAIEARYLAAAGVGTLRVREDAHAAAAREMDGTTRIGSMTSGAPVAAAPAAFEDLDPAARDVAIGAWRALASVRRALGQRGGG